MIFSTADCGFFAPTVLFIGVLLEALSDELLLAFEDALSDDVLFCELELSLLDELYSSETLIDPLIN